MKIQELIKEELKDQEKQKELQLKRPCKRTIQWRQQKERLNGFRKNQKTIHCQSLVIMTIRHTTIRLTLEDNPSLWVGCKLRDFAANCHTSPYHIQTIYIQPIQAGQTARETRENLRIKGWKSGSRVRV